MIWPLNPPKSVKAHLVLKTYSHGEVILRENEVGNKVCFLTQGRCKIYTTGSNGQILIQNVVQAPESFGMIEQFDQYPNVCTVEAFGPVTTQEISTENYMAWLALDNAFAIGMLQRVSAIAYTQIERQSINILSPLKQRFLGYLIAHYEHEPIVTIDKQLLAQMLATTLRHLNRVIVQCEKAKVLAYKEGKLLVSDWKALSRFKDL